MGDTTTTDMMNEAAAAITTLDVELTKVKSAWEVEATANLDLVKRIEALEAARNAEYRARHILWTGLSLDGLSTVTIVREENSRSEMVRTLRYFETEADARAAGQAYIDNLTAPEVTL